MHAKCKNGDEIEIGYGDTYPPGHVGQHTNVTVPWLRAKGGEWKPSPIRSVARLTAYVESCESAEELFGLIGDDAR